VRHFQTEVTTLRWLGPELGIDLRVKRDDLLPLSGGGNKVRKIERIVSSAAQTSMDALVTTGGVQSNHARVVALTAASRGWACSLVLHGEPNSWQQPEGNLLLMRLAGAEIKIVEPGRIGEELRMAVETLRARGCRPLLIDGGGHSVEGALAYRDAALELEEYARIEKWFPDWVVLASGTGTTQVGLLAGFATLQWKTRVMGISVARPRLRGLQVMEAACRQLEVKTGQTIRKVDIDFRDDWVGEGYEKASSATWEVIRGVAQTEGLVLDPTYTGKAFQGLLALVEVGEIKPGSRVLFWHTGGLLNLMAFPDKTRPFEPLGSKQDALHGAFSSIFRTSGRGAA